MISRRKWFIIPFSVLFAALGFLVAAPSTAGPVPLPPVPDAAIINQVIAGGGPNYVSLGIQSDVLAVLAAFDGVLDGVEQMVSVDDTVHYIDTHARLLESLMPLNGSASAVLQPEFTTPGADPRPGKIIGVVYHPPVRSSRAVEVVVAVFAANAFDCPGCTPPESIRLFYNSTQYNQYNIVHSRFVDPNGDGIAEAVDAGAVIAHDYSCVTVGLEQVCWEPYDKVNQRENRRPRDVTRDAYNELRRVYDVQVSFNFDDAVPDIIGPSNRARCAAEIASTISQALRDCMPNLIFTASTQSPPGQPIAVWALRDSADLRAYRTDGTYVGMLPPGRYLVVDATPQLTTPGSVAVLFLINANQRDHFLIPSFVVEGFGQSAAIEEHTAGIKDGFAWFRRW